MGILRSGAGRLRRGRAGRPGDLQPGGVAQWPIRRPSTSGDVAVDFGGPGDAPVPANYDGDDRSDMATYRPPASPSGQALCSSSGRGSARPRSRCSAASTARGPGAGGRTRFLLGGPSSRIAYGRHDRTMAPGASLPIRGAGEANRLERFAAGPSSTLSLGVRRSSNACGAYAWDPGPGPPPDSSPRRGRPRSPSSSPSGWP
jgi:hypothetical protein